MCLVWIKKKPSSNRVHLAIQKDISLDLYHANFWCFAITFCGIHWSQLHQLHVEVMMPTTRDCREIWHLSVCIMKFGWLFWGFLHLGLPFSIALEHRWETHSIFVSMCTCLSKVVVSITLYDGHDWKVGANLRFITPEPEPCCRWCVGRSAPSESECSELEGDRSTKSCRHPKSPTNTVTDQCSVFCCVLVHCCSAGQCSSSQLRRSKQSNGCSCNIPNIQGDLESFRAFSRNLFFVSQSKRKNSFTESLETAWS